MLRRTIAVVGLALVGALATVGPAGAASLYVTARDANAVIQFHIGAEGKLEALSPAIVGAGQKPTGVATSPDGKGAYAINLDSNDVSQYEVSPSGALGAKSPFSYSLAPGLAGGQPGIAVATGSANLYAVGFSNPFAGIFQFALGSNGQADLLDPPLLAVSDPVEIAIHPSLPKLYVSNKSGKKIQVMTIGAEGILANAASPSTTITPTGVAITPDGRFLYAAGTSAHAVAGFSIDQTTGALTELAGSPWEFTEGNAQDIAVTDSSVYVTATGGGVAMFSIDSLSGELTKKSPEKAATKSNPYGIVVSPEGDNVYVGTGSSVDQFAIGAGGLLTPLSPASVGTEKAPFPQLAISTTGSGGGEGPVGPIPVPPPPKPPDPPPPPKIVTEYVAYQYKLGEVLVMKVTKADGKTTKVELEVGKCYPPPNVKTKCAGLVEVKTRKAGNLVVVDEDARVGTKSVTLARGTFSIPAGKPGKIVLRPTAAGRKALKGKFLTAWLVTKLKNGSEQIAGQEKIKFKLR